MARQIKTTLELHLTEVSSQKTCTGGEVDVRGCYTAVATAHMLGLDKVSLAKQAGMVEFVTRCQVHHPVPFLEPILFRTLQGISQTNTESVSVNVCFI